MQHKINKKNLSVALVKSKLNFLDFLNKFVYYHVTKEGNKINVQESSTYTWIKNIYNNNQTHYEENTINTLSKILNIDPQLLIQNSQIDIFNKEYEVFLRARIFNYLSTQNKDTVENFKTHIDKDIATILKGL